jgi:uncharacterized small protein (DUF1192 family)
MARTSAPDDDRSRPSLGGDAELKLELHAIAELDELIRALTAVLERTPLTADQVKDFRQAIVEMAGNAFEWGRVRGQAPLV